MRKILFAVMSLLVIQQVNASLQIIKETADGILYIDPASVIKSGDHTKVMVFQDFHKMQTHAGQTFLASRVQYAYDCKKKLFQQLELTYFPENMANGPVVFSDQQPGPWVEITPGSVQESVMPLVCRR